MRMGIKRKKGKKEIEKGNKKGKRKLHVNRSRLIEGRSLKGCSINKTRTTNLRLINKKMMKLVLILNFISVI